MRNKVIDHAKRYFPEFDPAMVFDVGANIGQSSLEFSTAYPSSHVHAFEPVGAAYAELVENVSQARNVSCHQVALSDSERTGLITSNGKSTGNRLIPGVARGKTETVQIMTGDKFCADQGIERIDFLKVDAEGADLSVLVGFSGMLRTRCFQMIQVETGLSPENNRHASLEQISHFLFPFGYRIYGFFGLARHLGSKVRRSGAMFCDTAYIREDMADTPVPPPA